MLAVGWHPEDRLSGTRYVVNWDDTAFDFVADNAAAEFVILGSQRIDCRTTSFKTVIMKMEINGENRSAGIDADCLGSPLHALHWLALHLIDYGDFLKKGDLVMSRSLRPAIGVSAGDRVDMYLSDGAPVTVQFH